MAESASFASPRTDVYCATSCPSGSAALVTRLNIYRARGLFQRVTPPSLFLSVIVIWVVVPVCLRWTSHRAVIKEIGGSQCEGCATAPNTL